MHAIIFLKPSSFVSQRFQRLVKADKVNYSNRDTTSPLGAGGIFFLFTQKFEITAFRNINKI
jgi:hypothetical protein